MQSLYLVAEGWKEKGLMTHSLIQRQNEGAADEAYIQATTV